MAHQVEFLQPGFDGIAVKHVAIGVGHAGHVVAPLSTPLQLERVHAGLGQLVQVVDHANVIGGEQVAAALVRLQGDERPGAALDQLPAPAARLRAGAKARRALRAHELGGEQAAPGVGHAGGAVGKRLELQLGGHVSPELRDLRERHLTRQDHAPPFMQDACVERWTATSGATSRAREMAPRSPIMKASTPASAH